MSGEPTGHRWRVLGQLAADRSMPFVCVKPSMTSWARRTEALSRAPGVLGRDPPRQQRVRGRVKSTKTRPGNPYLQGALGVAALSAAQSKNTYFGVKYRRIASRRGPMKAIVAIERAVLVAIWNMARTGELYNDPGPDFYTRLHPDKAKRRALDQLRAMGCDVTLRPLEAAG